MNTIIIHSPTKFDFCRLGFIVESIEKKFNINFKLLEKESLYYSNCGSKSSFIILEYNNKKFFIECFDRIFEFSENGAKDCDFYFKKQYADEDAMQKINMHTEENKRYYKFLEWDNFYKKYSKKIKTFIITRPELICYEPVKLKKKYIISTYSAGHGDGQEYGKNRDKIYKIIKSVLGDKFNLKKHDTYGNNLFNNSGPLSYKDYLNLLSESYFMIYFSGKGFGTPFRICDGYLSNTVLLGEHIYTEAESNFPLFNFGWKLHENILNEDETKKKLHYLLEKYEFVYDYYIHKQRKWFDDNVNINNFYVQFLC